MDANYDAVIIGGGIAGSYTGKSLAEQGNKTLIVEEHREVGKPLQCAGLVSPRIFEFIPENGTILNRVRGAKIYSPSGKELVIDAKKTKALVIDRVKLDQTCIAQAVRAGCDLKLGAKALAAKYENGSVVIKVMSGGEIYAVTTKILIGADGVQGQVAHWFGLKRPKTTLTGFGAELTGVEMDPRFIEIYLGNEIAPNFFAWVIPKAPAVVDGLVPARVGLACSSGNGQECAFRYYHQLFSHPTLGSKLTASKACQYIAGGIPIGPVAKSYTDNVMLVGDAAGQVKPTSGGGVYTSLLCARYCAEAANRALKTKDPSAKILKSYQKAWLAELGKELKHGYRLYKVYMHLSDQQIDDGFKLLDEGSILDIISTHGDIDYPSKVTKRLFKRVPQLLKFARPYLRSFF